MYDFIYIVVKEKVCAIFWGISETYCSLNVPKDWFSDVERFGSVRINYVYSTGRNENGFDEVDLVLAPIISHGPRTSVGLQAIGPMSPIFPESNLNKPIFDFSSFLVIGSPQTLTRIFILNEISESHLITKML